MGFVDRPEIGLKDGGIVHVQISLPAGTQGVIYFGDLAIPRLTLKVITPISPFFDMFEMKLKCEPHRLRNLRARKVYGVSN